MADETIQKPGVTLGGFQLIEKVAEGGMGAVYKARQLSLDRIVAVKILPEHLAKDETFVRRFQQESRVAAQLKHPHLIEVYDAGVSDGRHYFVMEFVEGETVGSRLRREGPFPEAVALGICLNVAQALQHAWEKAKLIHGDIKPENLIIERDSRRVRIADLGLGKSLLVRTEDSHGEEHAMGTPAYVCPQKAMGEKKLDFRADMYSLGATFYHMITGNIPFDGLTPAEILAKHLHDTLPDPRTVRPGISANTVVILERMLAKQTEDRYPTWASLAHDLAQAQHGRTASFPPLADGKSTLHRDHELAQPKLAKRKATPLRIALELLVVALILAGGYWYFQIRPQPQPSAPESSTPTPAPGAERPVTPDPSGNAAVPPRVPVSPPAAEPKTVVEPPDESGSQSPRVNENDAIQKAVALAERRYTEWRPSFESALAAGEYGRAKDAAARARADSVFGPVVEKLERDERIAELILTMRQTAWDNLVGQTYFVGSTPGTVARVEDNKFWVKLSAGEVALNLESIDPSKLPAYALLKNRADADLNLGAALYTWYRRDKEVARTYFALAEKAGADVSRFLPDELAKPAQPPVETGERSPTVDSEGASASPGGANILSNPSFERWSGPTLLDWSTIGSQTKPTPDTAAFHGRTAVRFDLQAGQSGFVLEQPFQTMAGQDYLLQFHYRTQGFEGKFSVETAPPGDPTPTLRYELEPNPEWQIGTMEFSIPTSGTLVLRLRASNARGTVWVDQCVLILRSP